jgi:hypothetical protein
MERPPRTNMEINFEAWSRFYGSVSALIYG